MNRATLLLMAMAIAVAGCGVRRTLIRPADVPAYEEHRQHRLNQMQDDEEPTVAPPGAPDAAAPAPPPQTSPEPTAPQQTDSVTGAPAGEK